MMIIIFINRDKFFNRDKFISSKYGLYNFYESFYGNVRVFMSGLNML